MTFARNNKRGQNHFAHFAQKKVREIMESSKGKSFSANESPGCDFISRKMYKFSDLQRAFQGLIQQRNFA